MVMDAWKLRDFDPVLTNFSVGYGDKDLIGESVAPITQVGALSGRYLVFDRSAWLIYPDTRAQGTVANEITGAKWSEDTFAVHEHSLQIAIDDEEREQQNASNALAIDLDLEEIAVGTLTRSLMLGHEKLVADAFRLAANYPGANTQTLLTADQWDNYGSASSDPVADIELAMRQIYSVTGRTPNTLVIPWLVWSYIRNHPKIVDRFQNFRLTADEAFKELTGFSGTIIIPESQYNTADNIDATEVIADLWGKDVWLGIVDSAPGQRTKTFAKTFVYPYQGLNRPVDRWREENRKSDLIRESYRYDLKVVSNTAGYLYKSVIA